MSTARTTASRPEAALEWWTDWRAQQRHALGTAEQLLEYFPDLPLAEAEAVRQTLKTRRIRLTPYVLSLVEQLGDRRAPVPNDPIWRQLIPQLSADTGSGFSYDASTENWEMPEEMVTPIMQRKYENRAILRVANVCHSYCQFCYEALRTLEKESEKEAFAPKHWEQTLQYLRETDEIEEVILSGGEPFMLGDRQIESILRDLRDLNREVSVRIHTRSLTFNPFRVSRELARMLGFYGVKAIGLHVAHFREITPEFRDAAARLSSSVPILFANIPLLRGVNDHPTTFRTMLMNLYRAGVVPHYLYHFMPFSPGGESLRTSVRAGVELLRSVKRHITDLAVPEFVLPHSSGKHTMPILSADEAPAVEAEDEQGRPIVRYTNWKGDLIEYGDTRA